MVSRAEAVDAVIGFQRDVLGDLIQRSILLAHVAALIQRTHVAPGLPHSTNRQRKQAWLFIVGTANSKVQFQGLSRFIRLMRVLFRECQGS